MKTRNPTTQNPQTPPKASRKEMLATVERAVALMERPWDVRLTSRAKRALNACPTKLEYAYRLCWYVLHWDYQHSNLVNDDRAADYQSAAHALEEALAIYEQMRSKSTAREAVDVFRSAWRAWREGQGG